MATLENRYVQFSTNQNDGTFCIFTQSSAHPDLVNNSIVVSGWTADRRKFHSELPLIDAFLPASHLANGALELKYSGENREFGFSWRVKVLLKSEKPFVKWQLGIKNDSDSPIYLDKIFLLHAYQIPQENIKFSTYLSPEDISFLSNGWQSWSYSAFYRGDQKMRRSRLGFLQEPMVINSQATVPVQRSKFNSDLFAVVGDRKTGAGIAIGFLSQKKHFGTVSANFRENYAVSLWADGDAAQLDPGMALEIDPAIFCICNLDEPAPLDAYLEAVAAEHGIQELQQSPSGWCSWYYYYQDISEEKILKNLHSITDAKQQLPLDLFQIDDGYQREVGDWLRFDPKFPNGVKGLAMEVMDSGMTPGIWLAPFIVHPRASLAADHPDWLLREKRGKLARAGFVWNSLPYALDLTIPDAKKFVSEVIDTAVNDWGFPYLKLDFLYAAALKGVYHDRTKTRAMVLREGMEAIREATGPDTFLLGCGLPLGSALGLVDAMRISADVSGSWKPDYFNLGFVFKHEPHMPSAENAIHNVIVRSPMHNRWWVNDPDCLLIREESDLSLHEVQTLATTISMTGGSMLLSDDMEKLSDERLLMAASLVPPINQRPHVLDWKAPGTPARLRLDLTGAVGDWHLLSFSNWRDTPQEVLLFSSDFQLPEKDCFVYFFWGNRSRIVEKDAPLYAGRIAPHQTVWMSVRMRTGGVQYIGGNLHASQGLEISRFTTQPNEISIGFTWDKRLKGSMELFYPETIKDVRLGEQSVPYVQTQLGLVRITFAGNSPDTLQIN